MKSPYLLEFAFPMEKLIRIERGNLEINRKFIFNLIECIKRPIFFQTTSNVTISRLHKNASML